MIIETPEGFKCGVCGREFKYSAYTGLRNHNPERVAFYQALYHNCPPADAKVQA